MSPGTGAAEAEARTDRAGRKAAQRQRILDAARGVFFRDGFVAANLDEVADGAGVAKGTLYRYFENKAELYVAVLSQGGEIFERKLRDTLDSALPPAEQVRRMSRFYVRHWTEHRAYFGIFWALENEPVIGALPEPVVAQVTALWESCLRVLAGVLEHGIRDGAFAPHDPWEVANILWTLANGLIRSEQAAAPRQLRRRPLEAAFEDGVELVLRGLDATRPATA